MLATTTLVPLVSGASCATHPPCLPPGPQGDGVVWPNVTHRHDGQLHTHTTAGVVLTKAYDDDIPAADVTRLNFTPYSLVLF